MRILMVCTANRCRSPMAEVLLRNRLVEAAVSADVSSAGFGPPDQPIESGAVDVMDEIGCDLRGHVSRQVSPEMCCDADVILGMTRQHIVSLVAMTSEAWPRAFPIADLVDRVERMDPIGPVEEPRLWVGLAHGGRTPSSVLALPHAIDVDDPVGGPLVEYRRTRDRLAGLTQTLAQRLAAREAGTAGDPSAAGHPQITWDGWA